MIDKPQSDEIEAADALIEPASPKNKGASFALFIAFLALFFTAAGIAAGYKHWQRMNEKAKDNASQIALLQQALQRKVDTASIEQLRSEVTGNVGKLQQEITGSLQNMSQMQSQTRQFADTVSAQVEQITGLQARLQQGTAPTGNSDWQLDEVGFLLRLANQELHLKGDKKAAEQALKEADKRLSQLGSVVYLPVRQQITHDLATLDDFIAPDLAAISQQITALGLSLTPLGVDNSRPTAETEEKTQTVPAPVTTTNNKDNNNDSVWVQYKNKAIATLSSAIVVHQLDKPLAETLDNDARQSIYQLLQLRLEGLRLLALQQQNPAYHQQIALIRQTLQAYYPPNQAEPLLATLDQLAAIDLAPPVPDISGSLSQMEKARLADTHTTAKDQS